MILQKAGYQASQEGSRQAAQDGGGEKKTSKTTAAKRTHKKRGQIAGTKKHTPKSEASKPALPPMGWNTDDDATNNVVFNSVPLVSAGSRPPWHRLRRPLKFSGQNRCQQTLGGASRS